MTKSLCFTQLRGIYTLILTTKERARINWAQAQYLFSYRGVAIDAARLRNYFYSDEDVQKGKSQFK